MGYIVLNKICFCVGHSEVIKPPLRCFDAFLGHKSLPDDFFVSIILWYHTQGWLAVGSGQMQWSCWYMTLLSQYKEKDSILFFKSKDRFFFVWLNLCLYMFLDIDSFFRMFIFWPPISYRKQRTRLQSKRLTKSRRLVVGARRRNSYVAAIIAPKVKINGTEPYDKFVVLVPPDVVWELQHLPSIFLLCHGLLSLQKWFRGIYVIIWLLLPFINKILHFLIWTGYFL